MMIGPWEVIILLVMGMGALVVVGVVLFVVLRKPGKPMLRCACGALNPSDSRCCNQCGAQLMPPRSEPPQSSV